MGAPSRRLQSTEGFDVVNAEYCISFDAKLLRELTAEKVVASLAEMTTTDATRKLRAALTVRAGDTDYSVTITGVVDPVIIIATVDGTSTIDMNQVMISASNWQVSSISFVLVVFMI